MSIRVTVEDLETGDTETKDVADGDYVLICVAPCYLHQTNEYTAGTHVMTVKGYVRRRVAKERVTG